MGSSFTHNSGGRGLHYPATWAALSVIVKGLSYEFLGRGTRANLIAPALIDTSMLRERYPNNKETNEMLKAQVPLGRIGTPEDMGKPGPFPGI